MLLVDRVDRELAYPLSLAAGSGNQVHSHELASGFGYGSGQLAEGFLTGIEFDTDGNAVLS